MADRRRRSAAAPCRASHPRSHPLPDGRLLTGLNLDSNHVGDLVLVDGATERLIDSGVLTALLWLASYVGDDTIVYPVLEGDRSGLWMARLQPRE